ncbi:hypothetical protein [Microbacterium sp. W4I20]|uniref:hypothetical protein n=1 Tax=Microbacterium sp. W4I20 TaxID=3042262 RepID=UPI00278A5E1B|nr:hypothetical protein [Microbacterium sp. W4I20]MDQ0726318.1 hypothetical protein [Microbacterium sp. W4I20]
MTALRDLFPDGPRTADSGTAPMDDHHTVRRLGEMIGAPRESAASGRRPLANARELLRMVDAAADQPAPIATEPDAAPPRRRRARRPVDALALTAGVLAVVSVVAAGTVGAVQMATASPAASSLQALEADEAAIQNAHQSLVSTRDRILADVESQGADAAGLRAALVSTSTAPDPASSEEGALIEVTDAAALTTALAALDTYAKGLAAITVPELPAEYVRPELDEDSLVEVGSAIDAVQEQLIAGDAATVELRTLRSGLDALRPPAELAVAAYGASFPGAAEAAIARYPDADEALHTALSDAAAVVGSSNLWSPAGISAVERYRDALVAVAADQVRFEVDRQQNQGGEQPGSGNESGGTPPSDEGTDPPTESTDPPTETPPEQTPPDGEESP